MATDDTTSQEPEGQHAGKEPAKDDRDCCGSGTDDCNPDLLDELTCRAVGIARQAEYNAAAKPALEAARTAYPGIRTEYRKTRAEAALEVQELLHRAKQLIERVRCQIPQDRIVECLDDAFRCVVRKLKKCGGTTGCCSAGDCDFDLSSPETIEELNARLAEYEMRLQAEKDCFDRLSEEPAALTQRTAEAKAEIDAAAKELDGDQAKVDLSRVYVSLLVAQRHLQDSWGGFDRTQDFLDCLCHALTCWIKATEAVSILTGHLAVKECRRDEARKRCEALATKTVDEVLLEYERLCASDSGRGHKPKVEGGDTSSGECRDGESADPDDGRGNEHHHRHESH